MGEEEKKPEEKKMEGGNKVEEKKEEKPKSEEKKAEESKAPPPPPPEIVLRVYMHCEGCAKKVRRCLKGFEGVEDVSTDCKTHKVVVKGEKADPVKVLERVQKKSHRQVELLSPIPKPPTPEGAKKAEEKEVAKPEGKKEEPQVITVVLEVHMHCEACAQEIKRRILRMKGVENVEPDLKSSLVTVNGVFDPPKLVEYLHKRTGKRAVIVKPEPEKKKEGEKGKTEGKEEKKPSDGAGDAKIATEEKKEKKKEEGGGEATAAAAIPAGGGEEAGKVVELKKNEFYIADPPNFQIHPYAQRFNNDPQNFQIHPYAQRFNDDPQNFQIHPYAQRFNNDPQNFQIYPYPQRFNNDYANDYPHAPQMFSDENPNACTVM